jgi:gamma-glutamyltranspeptidase/glutathione hydrolase
VSHVQHKPGPFTTRPEIDGTFGVVASTHWIGTAVGMGVLERGGNAFDAGIATAFTLQVVEPHLCGPGGDVPVILYDQKTATPEVVCGQGPAPAGASIAHYRGELGLDIVPGTGLLPACVPGTFETYMMILRDHGTMRLRDVLEPALGYARNGHPLVERACATIATVESAVREHWPTSACHLPAGRQGAEPGTMFTNQRHADTYARILKEAEAGGGGTARRRSSGRASPGARASWPRRSTAFCRKNAVMDVSGRPPSRRADRAGHGELATDPRAAVASRLRQLSRAEAGLVDARPGAAADAGAAERLPARSDVAHRPRVRASVDGVRQARLCRP